MSGRSFRGNLGSKTQNHHFETHRASASGVVVYSKAVDAVPHAFSGGYNKRQRNRHPSQKMLDSIRGGIMQEAFELRQQNPDMVYEGEKIPLYYANSKKSFGFGNRFAGIEEI